MLKEDKEHINHTGEMPNSLQEYKLDDLILKLIKEEFFSHSDKIETNSNAPVTMLVTAPLSSFRYIYPPLPKYDHKVLG